MHKYITTHYITLRYVTLRYVTLHYIHTHKPMMSLWGEHRMNPLAQQSSSTLRTLWPGRSTNVLPFGNRRWLAGTSPLNMETLMGRSWKNMKIPINGGLNGKTHRKVWEYMRHLIKHGGLNRNIIHRIYCYVWLPEGTSPTFLLASWWYHNFQRSHMIICVHYQIHLWLFSLVRSLLFWETWRRILSC